MAITKEQLKEAFNTLDKNGDGSLCLKELKQVIPNADEKDLKKFIEACDKDGDNKVTFDELCKLFSL